MKTHPTSDQIKRKNARPPQKDLKKKDRGSDQQKTETKNQSWDKNQRNDNILPEHKSDSKGINDFQVDDE